MAAGDLHVVTIRRGLEGVVVPSKLYNILAHGRPILAVATERAEVARIVQQYDCGIAADPDDATQVREAIRCILNKPERLDRMSRQARKMAESYDRSAELRKFVDVIEEVAHRDLQD
jgi:glycosyltransferase involved in cell wall biosynthesis